MIHRRRRVYRSALRAEQAETTRQRILDAVTALLKTNPRSCRLPRSRAPRACRFPLSIVIFRLVAICSRRIAFAWRARPRPT